MRLAVPSTDAPADAPAAPAASPKQRGLDALAAGRVTLDDAPPPAAQEQQEQAPPEQPDDGPITAANAALRIRAALEAKRQAQAEQAPPPATPPAAPPPAAAPTQPGEPTYTKAQLLEALNGDKALDFLIEEIGANAVGLYDHMTERAQVPAHTRRALTVAEQNAARIEAIERQAEQAKVEAAKQAQQAEYRGAVNEFLSYVGANVSAFPLLAAESAAEQERRAVRASQLLQEAGEANGSPEIIAALAEDAIRHDLQRYPGVSLGKRKDPAVGAGTGSEEPTTLSGSISGDTSGESRLPPRGSRAWKEHFARRFEALNGA